LTTPSSSVIIVVLVVLVVLSSLLLVFGAGCVLHHQVFSRIGKIDERLDKGVSVMITVDLIVVIYLAWHSSSSEALQSTI